MYRSVTGVLESWKKCDRSATRGMKLHVSLTGSMKRAEKMGGCSRPYNWAWERRSSETNILLIKVQIVFMPVNWPF